MQLVSKSHFEDATYNNFYLFTFEITISTEASILWVQVFLNKILSKFT